MTSSHENIICRACLCDKQEILKSFLVNPKILEMYISCTNLQVDINDGLPMSLCRMCEQRCDDWYSFQQLCSKNESILKNRLINILIPTQSKDDHSIIIKQEIGLTNDTNELYFDEFSESTDHLSQDDLSQSSNDLNVRGCDEFSQSSDNEDDNSNSDNSNDNLESHKIPDETAENTNRTLPIKTEVSEHADCDDDQSKKKDTSKCRVIRRRVKKKFDCPQCGKLFKTRAKRSIHMPSHTGAKPFKCSICDKSFSTKDYVRIHMRNHTGEKPFLCTLCGKSFRQKSSLNTHYLTHTDNKPYACTLCDKTYKTKSYLNLHMKCHKT